jgi:hypothetical protein
VIIVILVVLVIVGALAHLAYTGIIFNGLRAMIQEMRSPELRSTHPRIRARDMDAGPRWAAYCIQGALMGLTVLVVVLAIAHWV